MAQQFRFDRQFEFAFGSGNDAIIIKPPIRIQFGGEKFAGSIDGDTPRGLNKINISLHNLSEGTRQKLVKDSNESKYIPIQLLVGYGQDLKPMFKGSVHRGIVEKRGADIITTIEALDGGFDAFTGYTSQTVRGKREAITKILQDMPNTTEGKVTKQDEIIRPRVLVGNSLKLLKEQVADGQQIFIDNEQLFIIKEDEAVSLFVPLVSAETGLINTPQRENSLVTFESMINPELRIGGLCKLESVVNKHLNGIYKIYSLSYSGDNYGEDWKMTVNAFLSDRFVSVQDA